MVWVFWQFWILTIIFITILQGFEVSSIFKKDKRKVAEQYLLVEMKHFWRDIQGRNFLDYSSPVKKQIC